MRGITSPASLLMESDSFNGSLSPNRLRTPQPYSNPRLDIYPSIRNQTPHRELKFNSHMGPGFYDFHDYTNRPASHSKSGFKISKSKKYPHHDIIRISDAPPPGTYDVPRIMSPDTPGSEIGKQISSPFKNSGRKKELMIDADHYKTTRDEVYYSHMGPGFYDLPDSWKPEQFFKYNRKPKKDEFSMSKRNKPYEKQWSLPEVKKEKTKAKTEIFDLEGFDKVELKKEIECIRNLPSYGY